MLFSIKKSRSNLLNYVVFEADYAAKIHRCVTYLLNTSTTANVPTL